MLPGGQVLELTLLGRSLPLSPEALRLAHCGLCRRPGSWLSLGASAFLGFRGPAFLGASKVCC